MRRKPDNKDRSRPAAAELGDGLDVPAALALAGVGAWEADPATGMLGCSPETAALFGGFSSAAAVPLAQVLARVHPDERGRAEKFFAETGSGKRELECRLMLPDGLTRWVKIIGSGRAPGRGGANRSAGVAFDISERKAEEAGRGRLNATLQVIRELEQLITREESREELARQACRILVGRLEIATVWIALRDQDGRADFVADAGFGEDFDPVRRELKAGEWPRCARRAFATGEIVVETDPAANCRGCRLCGPNRELARVCLRLPHGDQIYGVLVASLPAGYAGDREIRELFLELGNDIGFALFQNLRRQRLDLQGEILAGIDDMVTITDLEGNIVYVNKAECRQLRKSENDLVGSSIESFGDDPRRGATQREILETTLREGKWSGEVINTTRDGAEIVVDCRTSVLRDESGRPRYLCGIGRNITERKRMEESLRKEVAFTRAVFNSAAEGLCLYREIPEHPFMKFGTWNRRMVEITGYTMEEINRLGWYRALFPGAGEGDAAWRWLKAVREDESASGREWSITRKDGRKRIVTVSVSVVDPQADPVYMLALINDVTERARADAALKEGEERLRAVLENLGDGVFVHTLDGRMALVNKAACRATGYSREELLKLTVSDIDAGSRDRNDQNLIWKRLEKGDTAFLEVVHRRKDGSTYPAEVHLTLITLAGLPTILGVARDVSERKHIEETRRQMEAQIQQTQKLESLGVLAGGIAHDFNNILVAILGNADIALHELPPENRARHNLQAVVKASRRAADLCRQMLAYSGRGSFVIESVDLGELIEEMVELLKASISKKIFLRLELADSIPPLLADATQIRQVVMNMVVNAAEAIGDENGTITIAAGEAAELPEHRYPFSGPETPADTYAFLEIADTGAGMDDEIRSHIFEPFFSTKFTGRGLGLAAVLGIVRGHGGAIAIASKPGQGTRFTVFFPAEESGTAPGADAVDAGGGETGWRGSGKVLLVDDEAIVREVSGNILANLGFEVITAATGTEALEIFRRHRAEFAFVLVDLTMPAMDGVETLKELREIDPKVRAIISSGYTEADLRHRFEDAPAPGFIQKPYSLDELGAAIRRLLGPADEETS
ncbi:MAG TPA: PAS domain S-box protein [bacterium]|nr:PAS domain S-box protein [bacterium]HPQ65224.1 PAS domain S-box protein [bacterium]